MELIEEFTSVTETMYFIGECLGHIEKADALFKKEIGRIIYK